MRIFAVGVFGAEHIRGIMDFWDVYEDRIADKAHGESPMFDKNLEKQVLIQNSFKVLEIR